MIWGRFLKAITNTKSNNISISLFLRLEYFEFTWVHRKFGGGDYLFTLCR